jgi:hypothetical protein
VPSAPEDVIYGIARIDPSGRICERVIITALGWAGGDLLTFTADAGVVTARRDPGGMVTLPASAYITIPAALRRRCGLEPGDQVMLAGLPGQDTLAAYSLAEEVPGDAVGRADGPVLGQRAGRVVLLLAQGRAHRYPGLAGPGRRPASRRGVHRLVQRHPAALIPRLQSPACPGRRIPLNPVA